MVVLFAADTPAQPKKIDPKKIEPKKTDPKKADPKKSEEPKHVVDVMVGEGGSLAQVAYINEQIEKVWKENKITPSERCTDYEFLRRAHLDIVGRIAKLEEIDRFFKDSPERRRSMLIERLLEGEEFANNWANIWTTLLLTRTGTPKINQEQMHEWLTDMLIEKRESAKSDKLSYVPDWSKIATELLAGSGDSNENGNVNFILAHLGDEVNKDRKGAPINPSEAGKYELVPVTSRTTRLFLGLRTQCVQCHDHPFNGEWGQHHFWGINAFFRQVDTPNGRPTMMAQKKKKGAMPDKAKYVLQDDPGFNSKGIVSYERRSGVLLYTDATFLDGKKLTPPPSGKAGRRVELAKFITHSPYFAKAFVNRTWGHFFGRSFTKDNVDDFGEHNPVSHPELFDKLSDDWAKQYNHNPKMLIRWICNSRAYGLSSVANESNDKQEDEAFFARMLLKAMTPEQLFESLMTATAAKIGQDKGNKAKVREQWLNKLIVNFGDDEGNEGNFNGTVIQALMLMNGQDINDAIMDKETGTASRVMKIYPPSNAATAGRAMDLLFKASLNRPPTQRELDKIMNPKVYNFRPGTPPPRDPVAFWTGYYQDIFWALSTATSSSSTIE